MMISPKVFAAALSGLVSIVFWTVAVVTFWKSTFTLVELTALTTVTTTAVATITAYLMPDRGYVNGRAMIEHDIEREIASIERQLSIEKPAGTRET